MNCFFHSIKLRSPAIIDLIWISVFISCSFTEINAQGYLIERTPFSTRTNHEFSPVLYRDGIIFCTNQRDNSLAGYDDDENRLFKIFFTARDNSSNWKTPRIFSREITSGFNDGPVTFNSGGTIMYFTRNNRIDRTLSNIKDTTNKLGIYSAKMVNGVWENIMPFNYNDPLFIFTTPALTPDGQRLYFSSDMPGGFGGMDLYYCIRCGNDWCSPRNMGTDVNTAGNETFPFADAYGKVFFASDGHPGLGGKDLYFTMETNGNWIQPVAMDSGINTVADDFGICIDSTSRNGFFSSNRLKTDDIFSFSTVLPSFENCDTLRENSYCYTLFDERYVPNDTMPVTYKWDFGSGIVRSGAEVQHCFPGPGNYSVNLDITDQLTGDTIIRRMEYFVELAPPEQAYINSAYISIAGKPMDFDASASLIPGAQITDYLWDFGDGFSPDRYKTVKRFERKGEYTVRLGVKGKVPGQSSCVLKIIRIYESFREIESSGSSAERNISVLMTDDLSNSQRSEIEKAFSQATFLVLFDDYGIVPKSYPFLEKAISVLKGNPEIRLEIMLHSIDENGYAEKLSTHQAQEISFFLRNKGIDNSMARCRSAEMSRLLNHSRYTNLSPNGIIEFIYMKR